MSALMKVLTGILMLPVKLITLPFVVVGMVQQVMIGALLLAVAALAVVVIICCFG